MSDQSMPVAGGVPVEPTARDLFNTMLTERTARGIATYGMPLSTANGRDAHRDALEELIDAWQYVVQCRMERADLEARLAALRIAIPDLMGAIHDGHNGGYEYVNHAKATARWALDDDAGAPLLALARAAVAWDQAWTAMDEDGADRSRLTVTEAALLTAIAALPEPVRLALESAP